MSPHDPKRSMQPLLNPSFLLTPLSHTSPPSVPCCTFRDPYGV
jgi:hypothetical protein